jgi:hypothetical protein
LVLKQKVHAEQNNITRKNALYVITANDTNLAVNEEAVAA